MKTGFIGAGKVGIFLGRAFARAGVELTGFYSRSKTSAVKAAEFTGSRVYTDIKELAHESECLFLTVPDDSISRVFDELRLNADISGKAVCHCSGALTVIEAFDGIEGSGAYGYSVHPVFPISFGANMPEKAYAAFEGEGPHEDIICDMLEESGFSIFKISPEYKSCYHVACVFASNMINALVQESIELLTRCGISRQDAFEIIKPLVCGSIEHMLDNGPADSLTGPIERCDANTVRKHLACFSDEDEREIYRLLSKKLITLAERKHPDRSYASVSELLESPKRK